MTQATPTIDQVADTDGTLSMRLPSDLDQFVNDVAAIRRFTRSQAGRLLITIAYDRIMRLPENLRASAIKRL